jgi:hypothetical protein
MSEVNTVRNAVLILVAMVSIEAGHLALTARGDSTYTRPATANAQEVDACADAGSAETLLECRVRQRIFRNLDGFTDQVAERIAEAGVSAFDAQVQTVAEGIGARVSAVLDQLKVRLDLAIAQTDALLSAATSTLDQTDRILAETRPVLRDARNTLDNSEDVIDDSEDVIDDSENVIDDSKDVLNEAKDLLKRGNAALVKGEQAEQNLRNRIEQVNARLAALPRAPLTTTTQSEGNQRSSRPTATAKPKENSANPTPMATPTAAPSKTQTPEPKAATPTPKPATPTPKPATPTPKPTTGPGSS